MESQSHVVAVPRWTLGLHIIQLLFAVIILGLSAYGISFISYNVLIYSLVVCLCTFGVVIYMLVASTIAPKVYNMWAFLALNIWMIVFWIVQFSLVASLASLWHISCSYDVYYGERCTYGKRDLGGLEKRETTTYQAYYGALVAGALFGAAEFVLWLVVLIIFSIHLNRHRLSGAPSAPPPVYSGGPGVPLEKIETQPQASPYTAPYQQPNGQVNGQSQYNQPQPSQQQPTPQPNQPHFTQQPAPPQFTTPYTEPPAPVNRDVGGISPLSTTSESYNAAELAGPHPGGYNVSELSSTEHSSVQNGSTQYSTMQRSTMSHSSTQHSSTQHTEAAELSNGQYR
ncbi:hypothetical protein AOQ84DRAFT_439173 [Glonium stellatum]|uniref:MARVEL domain-containing protein n=1 Tax=Glonium stellatum TaxID=574774 RepID=A0A8E2F2K9_9PEZI|nr:hypothetical protein AOQ84DRAFT_439173 [Glonium stellatum]